MTYQEIQLKIYEYFKEECGEFLYPHDTDYLEALIASHKRQRAMIGEFVTERCTALKRMRFLPKLFKQYLLGVKKNDK